MKFPSRRRLHGYLPAVLRPRLPPFEEKVTAALLLCDISGFTALTESLAARGREGAEEIAGIVSSAFAPAIAAIHGLGGSIVGFGGDALFAIFPGEDGASRAVAAARSIARSFTGKGQVMTSAGGVTLRIRQAVHHGNISLLHLGERRRRHFLVTGPAVLTLARLGAKAGSGDLLISPSARAWILSKSGRAGSCPPPKRAAGAIETYLPERLARHRQGFVGEYRGAAVLFIESRGHALHELQAFTVRLLQILDRYEGTLLKTDLSPVGTKWLCVFGIPEAHEEDAERAARAALDLMAARCRPTHRGGLCRGMLAHVAIGTRARRCLDVMGDVVNTAARACAEASWGEVVLTQETRAMLTGVECVPKGHRAVKGKERPLDLHVLRKAGALVKPIRVSAPMVGRDGELKRIVDALASARDGHGSVIGIRGEAGMGKSRLKHEASKAARGLGVETHEGRAISFGGSPYHAIAALLRSLLGLPDVADRRSILASVEEVAEKLALSAVDRHHLAEVLGARFDRSPLPHLPPQSIRLNNMIAIRRLVAAMPVPVLLVLEDMHWADAMTKEAAEALAPAASEARFVLLLIYRPGYEPPRGASEIVLQELSEDATSSLLESHLGAVPGKVRRLIQERSGGNPFYLEELARHFLESGILGGKEGSLALLRDPRPEDMPDSVESVIAARLDRLSSDARKVAQVAAVIGRSFLFELLAHCGGVSRVARSAMRELCAKELVFERRDGRLEYVWKHAITREVAYSEILVVERRRLHRSVAMGLTELFPKERDALAAALGHHWEHAGERGRARESYLRGARRASDAYAHEEAERLYRSYLSLSERPTRESIAAWNELGERVLHVRGSMDDACAAHQRALAEARQIQDPHLADLSLRQLGLVVRRKGRVGEAREALEQALASARARGARGLMGFLLADLGTLDSERGRPESARAMYEQALAIAREVKDRQLEGVIVGYLANAAQEQGLMAEARSLYERSLEAARETGNRYREAVDLGNLASLHREQGRIEDARRLYEQALQVTRDVGIRPLEAHWLDGLATLCADEGRLPDAEKLHEQALQGHREVGNRRFEAISLGSLANVVQDQGRPERARELLLRSLQIHRDLGDRRFEAIMLGNLANLERLVTGDLETARSMALESEALLEKTDDKLSLAFLSCVKGHLALAAGASPEVYLERARTLVAAAGALATSAIGKEIARLDRAETAWRAGRPLVRGERPEDLPPGLRRWIEEHHPDLFRELGPAT